MPAVGVFIPRMQRPGNHGRTTERHLIAVTDGLNGMSKALAGGKVGRRLARADLLAMALIYQHQPGPVLPATLAPCCLIGEVVSLALLAFTGRVDAGQMMTALWLLPALAGGMLATRWFYGRLDGRPLRLATLASALLSGVVCLL